ncbi:glycosyltransferase family 2 protein [Candidatus Woesearchaeota archaeon]|nr:glycosyltransferase family 2 protein [Candidatus Woesearchaeota archaeon]
MELLPVIYLSYMFVSMYFLFLFLFLYFLNKKRLFDYPKLKKKYKVSFIIPAYNEERTIKETLEHIFSIDYDNISQVIVVNDNSTDKTKEIVESLKKDHKNLILINNKKNLGNAAKTKNVGLKYANGEIIAFVDADSYPAKDSLKKMLGFFEDKKVGAVTCPILVKNQSNIIEKMQELEYKTIATTRKLLGYLDSIYVTPGPLALYRKKALEKINGFDEENLTEDIEITWGLAKNNWKREMSLSTQVTTTAPDNLKDWYKQRLRWTLGGLQCIVKYKKEFLKKGILGMFILPFFILQFFLGVIGIGVFLYLLTTRVVSNYIFAKYAIPANVPLLTLNDFFITPSFLDYLGIILFVSGFIFTLLVIAIIEKIELKEVLKKQRLRVILSYSLIYLSLYPLITIIAIYKYFKREKRWR